jgi:hypothetical protein
MFLGQYETSASKTLISNIQDAYSANLTPELILFIYPSYISDEVDSFLQNQNNRVDLTRNKFSPVIALSFDIKGRLQITHELGVKNKINFNFTNLSLDIIKAGYSHLIHKRSKDILVKAPAGTTFVKPSGKVLEEFIYASQLARNNYEYQFLAMSLLRYAPDLDDIDTIYIDTSSISTIAESVIYYISKFKGLACKHITYQSFSSYSGLEKIGKPDNIAGSWIIISASASTSMGKKFVRDWNINPKQIITILSYKSVLKETDENIGNSVVFSLNNYSSIDKENFSPIKVQVQGESFSAEVSNPRKALLVKKYKPDFVDESIYKFRNSKVFSLNKKGYTLYVDYINLKESFKLEKIHKLQEWIKQVVTWSIPNNLSAIVIGEGTSEKSLLNDFKLTLKANGFDLSKIKELDSGDVTQMQALGDKSVLVLSSVISSGRFFIDVNRELRLANHSGMRIFATPFVVAPSRKQHASFVSSLTQGPNGFKYTFISFNKIFTGNKSLSSWRKELDVIKKLITASSDSDTGIDFWISRKNTLEKEGEGLNGKIGIHYSDPDRLFELAPDFAFWPHEYQFVDLEAVYATVSSILQNLRDNEIDGLQLSANIYQHCVIDPENFVRFNDSILQSCLWRCAMPGELDYRRSDELSNDLQRILRKIFMSSHSTRGVTSIDFLMGLATRWIKISDEAMQAVIADAEKYLKEPHAVLLTNKLKSDFPPPTLN